jgi:hypothetical protein
VVLEVEEVIQTDQVALVHQDKEIRAVLPLPAQTLVREEEAQEAQELLEMLKVQEVLVVQVAYLLFLDRL